MRIGLFVTCLGDTLFREAPRAAVAVLERLGHDVVFECTPPDPVARAYRWNESRASTDRERSSS
jgi:hypothetical protein